MKAEQLDISIEEFGKDILITMSGNFYVEQVPNINEKMESLISDGHRDYILDIDQVIFRNDGILNFFVDLLNNINGRKGRLILIYNDDDIKSFFFGYHNIFERFSSIDDYHHSSFVRNLKRIGVSYSKKTGIRISTGVAFIIILLFSGWVLSLFGFIKQQNEQLTVLNSTVVDLKKEREKLLGEVYSLKSSIGPLIDMGMINDSLDGGSYDDVSDWIKYLEALEKRRDKRFKPPVEEKVVVKKPTPQKKTKKIIKAKEKSKFRQWFSRD